MLLLLLSLGPPPRALHLSTPPRGHLLCSIVHNCLHVTSPISSRRATPSKTALASHRACHNVGSQETCQERLSKGQPHRAVQDVGAVLGADSGALILRTKVGPLSSFHCVNPLSVAGEVEPRDPHPHPTSFLLLAKIPVFRRKCSTQTINPHAQ